MNRTKLLLVEDEPVVLRVCEATLSRGGFDVIAAQDGVEGLAAFGQYQKKIALVLADVAMPLMDGLHMVRQIHKLNPDLKVVLMTGYDPQFVVPADLKEFCCLLRKPFTAHRLLESVESCLGSRHHHGWARLDFAGPDAL